MRDLRIIHMSRIHFRHIETKKTSKRKHLYNQCTVFNPITPISINDTNRSLSKFTAS